MFLKKIWKSLHNHDNRVLELESKVLALQIDVAKAIERLSEHTTLKEQNKQLLDRLLAFNEKAFWAYQQANIAQQPVKMFKDDVTGEEIPYDQMVRDSINQVLGN